MITLALDEVGYNNALIGEYYHVEAGGRAGWEGWQGRGGKMVIDRAGDGCLTPNGTNCNAVWSD